MAERSAIQGHLYYENITEHHLGVRKFARWEGKTSKNFCLNIQEKYNDGLEVSQSRASVLQKLYSPANIKPLPTFLVLYGFCSPAIKQIELFITASLHTAERRKLLISQEQHHYGWEVSLSRAWVLQKLYSPANVKPLSIYFFVWLLLYCNKHTNLFIRASLWLRGANWWSAKQSVIMADWSAFAGHQYYKTGPPPRCEKIFKMRENKSTKLINLLN